MSKISSAYSNTVSSIPAAGTPASRTLSDRQDTLTTPNSTQPSDRITLSAAGLAAAAHFSNLIVRPANIYTPALPAPQANVNPATLSTSELTGETPKSRDLVRKKYAQQQELAACQTYATATHLDIRI